MCNKFGVSILCGLFVCAAGCDRAGRRVAQPAVTQSHAHRVVTAFLAPGEYESRGIAGNLSLREAGEPLRYIATRHRLEVITSPSSLSKAWELVIAFCGSIDCTVVSSSLVAQTRDTAPSGHIFLRISPGDLKKLFDRVEKEGQIIGHETESEDKTTAVLDTDARIKNLTSFRDSLRSMLAKPQAKVSDLVEIQEKLTDVQSQLDSETAQRKVLANETEKVAVEIQFGVEHPNKSRSTWAPIADALRESGFDLATSVGWLISAMVSIAPWLALLVPLWLFLAKLWRRRKLKGSTTAS